MRRAIPLLLLFLALLTANVAGQPTSPPGINLQDEGVGQGRIQTLNCVGAGVSCARSGSVGTATVTSGGGGTPGGNSGDTQTNDGAGGFAGLHATAARGNLGLGSIATQAATNVSINGGVIAGVALANITSLSVANSGVAATARLNLGLGAVATLATINLAADATGNLPVSRLNSGASASSSTFWRGDGAWAAPPGAGTPGGNSGDFQTNDGAGGFAGSNATTVRTNLGLGSIATQAASNVSITGGTIANVTRTGGTLVGLSSPLALTDGGTSATTATAARTNFGLGSIATQAANNVSITGGTIANVTRTGGTLAGLSAPVVVVDGGTGATTAATARTNLGLGSIATHAQINLATDTTGNLGVSHLGSGTSASATTFWRGDASWATPAGGSARYFFTGFDPTSRTASAWMSPVGACGTTTTCSTTENVDNRLMVPAAGTIKNLYARFVTTQGASDVCTVVVGIGADVATAPTATALTCAIGDTQNSCSDLVNTVAVTATQSISLLMVETAGTCITGGMWWSFELTPS